MNRVAVFMANGFEEIEALSVVDYLRRANVSVNMVSISDEDMVEGAHGIAVLSDSLISDFVLEGYSAVVFPGGMPGTRHLYENEKVLEIVKEANRKGLCVGAICAAPLVLYHAGILEGKNVTSYPSVEKELKGVIYHKEKVVVDENIITSRSAATAVDFALKLIEVLVSKEESDRVANSVFC